MLIIKLMVEIKIMMIIVII